MSFAAAIAFRRSFWKPATAAFASAARRSICSTRIA
jgi:hypothetical protein